MRVEIWLALAVLLSGCAINLASDDAPSPAPSATAPALSGCLPLADRASTLTGRLSLVTLPDQSSLVLADSATVNGSESSVGFSNASADCLTQSSALSARPIIDVSALAAGTRARPLGSVSLDDTFVYFSADHSDELASDGIGIARWDPAAQRFVALFLLWTADRPSYGSTAALVDDEVYVLGGLSARFLAADVYLARVPSAQLTVASAYEYWQGGGNFGSDPDSALPLVEGGTSPSVAFDLEQQRWLLLYATPLANELTVRSGLGITGPWSAPYTLGRCDLPSSDPSSFCSAATLLPALAGAGEIAFSQEVNTFSRPAQATDADFWTRLVRAPWPSMLP
jgi:hypothetical protein